MDIKRYFLKLLDLLIFQYGKDYEYDAPVKLLVKHLHSMAESPDEQLVVVSQVISSLRVISVLIRVKYSFIAP